MPRKPGGTFSTIHKTYYCYYLNMHHSEVERHVAVNSRPATTVEGGWYSDLALLVDGEVAVSVSVLTYSPLTAQDAERLTWAMRGLLAAL